ncbi:hypothetical protein CF15_00025 [Pyrodictium occultum]|uniref:Phosphoadenosine phosphosulphate reductase domain-containing protein n=1 Tax=Pyrodictium occultum TaxID=2309 RepID=A0A0V8RTB0_PYROC|nr:phosphoadenosine phosphosulfate reductase family protein [Pyrodictium occultum]KSW11300.1 hypothetical protein CF15_00025 [Pyrodictium occultum]
MTELYPLLRRGELAGVLGSGGEATKLCSVEGGCRYYLWISKSSGVDVTGLLDRRGILETGQGGDRGFAPVKPWLLSPPYVHARAVPDLDEYARMLARWVGRELRGRRVLLGFSGGKDSMAALAVLLRLQEYIDFKIHVMFVHIPFLESPRSVEFVEKAAARLGVEVDMRAAPRREMKSLLKWKGMPRRGYRFCTMYKARPMREERKKDPRLLEVVGDRLTESPKRFERLSKAAANRVVLAGRKFRPTYMFTLADIVEVVRGLGLVHPDYLDGVPRVACTLCPYKALHEFEKLPPLEDPELIEKVLEKTWRRWYSWTSLEVFREQHLWRFGSGEARLLLNAKKAVESAEGLEEVSSREVAEAYRRVWLEGVKAPALDDPWRAAELALRAMRAGLPVAVPEDY